MSRTTLRVRGPARLSLLTFTRERMREVDRACVEEFGIPPVVLMENAAAGVAAECLDLLSLDVHEGGAQAPHVVVFAGPGNNGGDGFATARRMHNHGARVTVFSMRAPGDYAGEAGVNARVAEAMGLPIHVPGARAQEAISDLTARSQPPISLVVDALLGTGLSRPIEGQAAEMVAALNRAGRDCPVISVDCPSGLDVERGRPMGESIVQATHTVTLGGMKRGLDSPSAARWCGRLTIADIGAPIELLERLAEPIESC